MTQATPVYKVLKELHEDEEPSSWTKSVLSENPEGGGKLVLARLHKEKILQFYTYRESAEGLTPEIRKRLVEKATAMFNEEDARFAAINNKVVGLTHPNIAKVIKVEKDPQTKDTVVVFEYAPGKSIADITSGMTVEAMIPFFLNMIEAVIFMHQNSLLHLNLKSKRIRVDDGLNLSVKLTDFGYAADFGKFEDYYFPAPGYCAPEVALKQKDKIGETSDLYSLGAIMYHCMARVAPFPERASADTPGSLADAIAGESEPMKPSEKNPHILEMPYIGGIPYKIDSAKVLQLEEIVMDLIQKNVEDRKIRTALELSEKISAIFKDACKDRMTPSSSITFGI